MDKVQTIARDTRVIRDATPASYATRHPRLMRRDTRVLRDATPASYATRHSRLCVQQKSRSRARKDDTSVAEANGNYLNQNLQNEQTEMNKIINE